MEEGTGWIRRWGENRVDKEVGEGTECKRKWEEKIVWIRKWCKRIVWGKK